jgi:hypothetical protein
VLALTSSKRDLGQGILILFNVLLDGVHGIAAAGHGSILLYTLIRMEETGQLQSLKKRVERRYSCSVVDVVLQQSGECETVAGLNSLKKRLVE